MSEKAAPIWTLPDFEEKLERLLKSRTKILLPADGMITAAVLVPLFSTNGSRHVLLTKRSDFVEHHKGEISFPGGKVDPSDANMLACALRETAEEIGVDPKDVRVLGELDDFYTVATRYLVIPFVGIIPYPYEFRPSAREISGLLRVPLEVFFDPSRRSEDTWTIEGQSVEVTSYLWQGHNIWGATARILKHFTELIEQGGI
ncbi:MAG: CoA pyrophosphatase [Desulfomonile tiedjei]|uniref:CoA pyrophosphatase n=1 Tax=Desulfomonile tiedjei TaxID=2358 RepID=A0A9D6Z4W7_9BACT|nr:CoA pyrophosphatase [Desulfomonile tiedjei]